jgi:hypothetical protein
MSGSEIPFYGTGDRVIDTLLIYALSDLARMADPRSTFSWALGREIIFKLHSSQHDIKDKMLNVLKDNIKSLAIADRLNFKINVGGTWKVEPTACLYCAGKGGKTPCNMKGNCGKAIVPAYPVFFHNLGKLETINWSNAYCISKDEHKNYETLYLGLSPFWSKGFRRWNSKWDGHSSYLPNTIQALLFYALSKYAIITSDETFIELILSPPPGIYIEHTNTVRIVELVKRLVARFSVGIKDINLSELPVKIVPLVMLSQMDLPSIIELSQKQLTLLFIAYSIDRGAPKNARGYEEQSLVDIATFYSRLGDSFWDFKCMVEDLINKIWQDEFKHRIQNILIDFSYAISGRDVWRLNDALFKVEALCKDSNHRIHLLTQDSAMSARYALEKI